MAAARRAGLVLLGPAAGYLAIRLVVNPVFGRHALVGPLIFGYSVGLLIFAYWCWLFVRWWT